jgi:hypothetical protein
MICCGTDFFDINQMLNKCHIYKKNFASPVKINEILKIFFENGYTPGRVGVRDGIKVNKRLMGLETISFLPSLFPEVSTARGKHV